MLTGARGTGRRACLSTFTCAAPRTSRSWSALAQSWNVMSDEVLWWNTQKILLRIAPTGARGTGRRTCLSTFTCAAPRTSRSWSALAQSWNVMSDEVLWWNTQKILLRIAPTGARGTGRRTCLSTFTCAAHRTSRSWSALANSWNVMSDEVLLWITQKTLLRIAPTGARGTGRRACLSTFTCAAPRTSRSWSALANSWNVMSDEVLLWNTQKTLLRIAPTGARGTGRRACLSTFTCAAPRTSRSWSALANSWNVMSDEVLLWNTQKTLLRIAPTGARGTGRRACLSTFTCAAPRTSRSWSALAHSWNVMSDEVLWWNTQKILLRIAPTGARGTGRRACLSTFTCAAPRTSRSWSALAHSWNVMSDEVLWWNTQKILLRIAPTGARGTGRRVCLSTFTCAAPRTSRSWSALANSWNVMSDEVLLWNTQKTLLRIAPTGARGTGRRVCLSTFTCAAPRTSRSWSALAHSWNVMSDEVLWWNTQKILLRIAPTGARGTERRACLSTFTCAAPRTSRSWSALANSWNVMSDEVLLWNTQKTLLRIAPTGARGTGRRVCLSTFTCAAPRTSRSWSALAHSWNVMSDEVLWWNTQKILLRIAPTGARGTGRRACLSTFTCAAPRTSRSWSALAHSWNVMSDEVLWWNTQKILLRIAPTGARGTERRACLSTFTCAAPRTSRSWSALANSWNVMSDEVLLWNTQKTLLRIAPTGARGTGRRACLSTFTCAAPRTSRSWSALAHSWNVMSDEVLWWNTQKILLRIAPTGARGTGRRVCLSTFTCAAPRTSRSWSALAHSWNVMSDEVLWWNTQKIHCAWHLLELVVPEGVLVFPLSPVLLLVLPEAGVLSLTPGTSCRMKCYCGILRKLYCA
ncbi:hypothetical protein V3C99_009894 [Haemonchus contortus]